MTTLELLLVTALGAIGFLCLLVCLLLLAASVIEREVSEFRFRRGLREAMERDERRARKPARHSTRAHSRSHLEPVASRRPRV